MIIDDDDGNKKSIYLYTALKKAKSHCMGAVASIEQMRPELEMFV